MILLIGATGTVLGQAATQLALAGVKLRVMARDPRRAEGLLQLGIEICKGDAGDPPSCRSAFNDVDKILFATTGDAEQADVEGKIVEAAKAAQVRHLIKISMAGASIESTLGLARVHGEVEQRMERSGIACTFLRPTFFMQNLFELRPAVVDEGCLPLPLGSARVAMVDTHDVAACAVKAATEPGHEGRRYDITGPAALGGRELAETLSAAIGRTVQFVDEDPRVFEQRLYSRAVTPWKARALLELFAEMRRGWGSQVSPATADLLGRPPRDFTQFAQEHAQVFVQAAA